MRLKPLMLNRCPADMRQTDLRFSYQMDSGGFRNQGPWPSAAEIVAVVDRGSSATG